MFLYRLYEYPALTGARAALPNPLATNEHLSCQTNHTAWQQVSFLNKRAAYGLTNVIELLSLSREESQDEWLQDRQWEVMSQISQQENHQPVQQKGLCQYLTSIHAVPDQFAIFVVKTSNKIYILNTS